MAMPGGAAVAGAMYGYPKCCRESFVTHSAKTEDGKALRALGGRARRAYQRRMDLPMWGPDWPYSPEIEYVPCAQCSTRIESGGEPLPLEYERTRGEVVFSVDDVAQMAHAAQALESDEFAAVRAWLLAGRGDARNVAARQKLRERARVHPHDMSMHSCNNCGASHDERRDDLITWFTFFALWLGGTWPYQAVLQAQSYYVDALGATWLIPVLLVIYTWGLLLFFIAQLAMGTDRLLSVPTRVYASFALTGCLGIAFVVQDLLPISATAHEITMMAIALAMAAEQILLEPTLYGLASMMSEQVSS